jgi:sugar/nucleoside kinase (ribokinase family)
MVPAVAWSPVPDLTGRFAPSAAERARFDVVGIGNALVDVIAPAEEEFLSRHDLVKGSMTLIDTDRAVQLYAALDRAVEMSGGSAANTVCGIASFGGRAAYIGKVNGDDLGDVFGHDMRAVGVTFHRPARVHETPTGRCVIVVTPDAERTMNTYLGVSSYLGVDDLDETVIAESSVLYMEGYLYDRDDAKEAFHRAAEVAHDHGRMVSLTLSDSFCVDRHRSDFRSLVQHRVDLLFGNHDELLSLYELDSFDDAVAALRDECEFAAITVGSRGCVIITPDELLEVPAVQVERVIDTTGAGDLFAAGFLFGLTSGRDLEACGHLGSLAAAEVISHVGPRPLVELRSLISDDR